MLHFMSLLPKLMNQQVDEDLRLREQSILVSMRADTDGIIASLLKRIYNYNGMSGRFQGSLIIIEDFDRAPDKSAYLKTFFFISHPKYMLLVLKRTVSMRQFF